MVMPKDDRETRLAKIAHRNRQRTYVPGKAWDQAKWIESVTQYLILGNMRLVSAVVGIPEHTLRKWKRTTKWKEIETEIRAAETITLDEKLSSIVEKSLEATLDRVENGDYIYDQKTGEIRRKPASLRDVHRVAIDVLSKRELLRDKEKETTGPGITVNEQLAQLANEFAKWVEGGRPKEVLEMVEVVEENDNALSEEWEEGLQAGTGVGTQEETESSPREGSPEQSAGDLRKLGTRT